MKKRMVLILCTTIVFSMLSVFTGCSEKLDFMDTWESTGGMSDYIN